MEIWTKNRWAMLDNDPRKFWIRKDWMDESLAYPSTEIATDVVAMLMRQSPNQRMVFEAGYDDW
jgi:hypothetical protein